MDSAILLYYVAYLLKDIGQNLLHKNKISKMKKTCNEKSNLKYNFRDSNIG